MTIPRDRDDQTVIREECRLLAEALVPRLETTYQRPFPKRYPAGEIVARVFGPADPALSRCCFLREGRIIYGFGFPTLREFLLRSAHPPAAIVPDELGAALRVFHAGGGPDPAGFLKRWAYRYPRRFMNELCLIGYYHEEVGLDDCVALLRRESYFTRNPALTAADRRYLDGHFPRVVENAMLHLAAGLAEQRFYRIGDVLCDRLRQPGLVQPTGGYFDLIPEWVIGVLACRARRAAGSADD